jgi:hypothetical protein
MMEQTYLLYGNYPGWMASLTLLFSSLYEASLNTLYLNETFPSAFRSHGPWYR